MALTLQDFSHGVDFTGINPATGGDHNNLVDLASPVADASVQGGKGLVLYTIDSAINTPRVPDPTQLGYDKWMRYLWVRRPVAGSPNTSPQLYAWNDDALTDATYLNWIEIVADTGALQAQITAIVNQLGAIQATAVNAQTVANQANTTANQANANSQNALNQIAGATTTANAAKAAADAATAAVTTLTADLNTLQQQVNSIVTTSIPTLTNLVRSCAILAETAASTTSLGALVVGRNIRNINTKVYDAQNLITLSAGKIQFNVAGTYRVKARVAWTADVGGNQANGCQAFLVADAGGAILGTGQSTYISAVSQSGANLITAHSEVMAILTLTANTVIHVDLFASTNSGFNGVAAQSGVFPGGTTELYTLVEINQIF